MFDRIRLKKKKQLFKILHVRIPDDLSEFLETLCDGLGITKTEAIAKCIDYLRGDSEREIKLLRRASKEMFAQTNEKKADI